MKRNGNRVFALLALLCVPFFAWSATRSTLTVRQIVYLRLDPKGKMPDTLGVNNLLPDLFHRHASVTFDQLGVYILGQQGDVKGIFKNRVGKAVGFNVLKRKDGRSLASSPDYISVNRSGDYLWTVGSSREDFPLKREYPSMPALVCVYKVGQTRPAQEWRLPVDVREAQFVQAIDDNQLYVTGITGNVWTYTLGQAQPTKKRLDFGAFFLDTSGKFWSYEDNYPGNEHKEMRREYSLKQASLEEAPSLFCHFFIEHDNSYSRSIFWHDSKAGVFLSRWTEPYNQKKLTAPTEAIYQINKLGVNKLFETNDVLQSFTPQAGEYLRCGQALKGDKEGAVWIEVLSFKTPIQKTSSPASYQIVKAQRLPRWRAWWNSLTGQ